LLDINTAAKQSNVFIAIERDADFIISCRAYCPLRIRRDAAFTGRRCIRARIMILGPRWAS
jgi:hypothetical protein